MRSKSLLFVAALLATSLSSPTAFAQSSSPSRATVKAETRAANKAGKLTPAGEAANPTIAPASGPTTTRAERKSATLAARKAGALTPAGPNQKADVAIQKQAPTKTRAERKSETLDAKKKGELVPAGEGPGSPKK